MTWFDYVLIGWLTIGATLMVTVIGKERKPIEPSTAAIGVLINAAIIVGLVLVG